MGRGLRILSRSLPGFASLWRRCSSTSSSLNIVSCLLHSSTSPARSKNELFCPWNFPYRLSPPATLWTHSKRKTKCDDAWPFYSWRSSDRIPWHRRCLCAFRGARHALISSSLTKDFDAWNRKPSLGWWSASPCPSRCLWIRLPRERMSCPHSFSAWRGPPLRCSQMSSLSSSVSALRICFLALPQAWRSGSFESYRVKLQPIQTV